MDQDRKKDEDDHAQERLRSALRLVVDRYWRQAKARPWLTALALLTPGIGNIFVIYVPPLAIARLLGKLAAGGQPKTSDLALPIVLLCLGWAVGEVLWRFANWLLCRVEAYGMQALYIEAMEELLAKDVGFFHDNFAGSLTKRALGYARRFEDVFDTCAFSVVANVLPLGFVIVVLWRFSPWLIVALISLMVLTAFIVRPFLRARRRLVQIREDASTVLAGHVADSIANAVAVRAFAREKEEAAIHERNVSDLTKKMLHSWDYQNLRVDTLTSPMYVLTNTIGLVLAIAIGRGNGLGVEAVFLTFNYFASSTRVMWEFNRTYRQLEAALTDAAQFTELLLEPPAIVDAVPALPLSSPSPASPRAASVRFRSVSFGYRSKKKSAAPLPKLFDHFDLSIAPGEKVGLVGRSGAGKTTLSSLLLRFADLDSGVIEIADHDISRLTQSDLRSLIASVPQDPAMFHRTIADNIRFGRPEATDQDVRRAADLAHASEFIEALPHGYNTLVGERGIKLSGGQRQRIAIARAILKDAPVLLLDEATSALDSESESKIQAALFTLMRNRTTIVIAHRLSTIRELDRLIVLDSGQIVEEGTHDKLLQHQGIYASLWTHQSGGFLPISLSA